MSLETRSRKITMVLLLTGIVFLSYGAIRKEHKVVEAKSNIICLECIGIG